MRHRPIELTTALLGTLWLAAIAIELCSIAGLVGIEWRISAIVVHVAVFVIAAALLLTTNTRRPAGVDPNAPRNGHAGDAPDALRPGVLLPDNRPYGRRAADDRAVVDRLSEVLEDAASRRPGPARTPEWALNLMPDDADVQAEMAHGDDDTW